MLINTALFLYYYTYYILHVNYFIFMYKVQYLFIIRKYSSTNSLVDVIAFFFSRQHSRMAMDQNYRARYFIGINRRDNGLFDALCVKYAASAVIAIDISAGRGACEKSRTRRASDLKKSRKSL